MQLILCMCSSSSFTSLIKEYQMVPTISYGSNNIFKCTDCNHFPSSFSFPSLLEISLFTAFSSSSSSNNRIVGNSSNNSNDTTAPYDNCRRKTREKNTKMERKKWKIWGQDITVKMKGRKADKEIKEKRWKRREYSKIEKNNPRENRLRKKMGWIMIADKK